MVDKAPQIYKPREGKVKGQKNEKFTQTQRDYIYNKASELINRFGYQNYFDENAVSDTSAMVEKNTLAFIMSKQFF